MEKQSKQLEVRIRLDYYETPEDTMIDCESICPLAKNGIDCEKLRHPENPNKNLMDFCDVDGENLKSNFVPNYEDVMKFYTSEEIENASGYVPEIVEDWIALLEKKD